MESSELALFRHLPRLRDRLPRRCFLEAPTPVEPLPLAGVPDGWLYVKRDDQSCRLYGGNKPRKLEFVIGRALEWGARSLITTGGLGTNHGLATTILGAAAGLETTLVLLDQPLTPQVREALLLQAAYGARLRYGWNLPGTALQAVRTLVGDMLRGQRPYLVPTGGSCALGNLGFVSAALELEEQVRAGEIPEPAEIYLPVGTGGTLAGLVGGLRLTGLRSRVVGVMVTDILPPSPRRLARAARASLALLRRLDPAVPEPDLAPSDFVLVHGELGQGYGSPTEAGRAAVAAAAQSGLELETTYTGKCLAAIQARAAGAARPNGPVLFWNTYNAVDVKARAPRPLREDALPRSFRRVLARSGALSSSFSLR